jgi:hypothetical protein
VSKYELWVGGKHRGFVWAFDEFDARWRYARRCGVPVESVSAVEVSFESR